MKNIKYILILIILAGLFSPMVKINAADPTGLCITTLGGEQLNQPDVTYQECADMTNPSGNTNNPVNWTSSSNLYHLLAPLPCQYTTDPSCTLNDKGQTTISTFDPTQANNLGAYLNIMIKIFIGICAVLSVVMIVIGGLEYMTSELISSKEAGKEKIRDALLGLLIALGAYALLFTINPNLLNSDINIPATTAPATTPAVAPTGSATPAIETLPAGVCSLVTYDANGRVVSATDPHNTTSVGCHNNYPTYTWLQNP